MRSPIDLSDDIDAPAQQALLVRSESQQHRPATDANDWISKLGPGLVTGAADDDPSGIATYSQVGAQFGYGLGWTLIFSLPLMIAIQLAAARIGVVTGAGIARNLRLHAPSSLLRLVVGGLVLANIVNIGADLGAMSAALTLLIGGPLLPYTIGFGLICVVLEIFVSYRRYAGILKWSTLSLLAYVAVVFAAHVPLHAAVMGALLPHFTLDRPHVLAIAAILGTTISPYLFFWQADQEIEEQRRRHVLPLGEIPATAGPELSRLRIDTIVGMAVSNIVALFIVLAAAATLNSHGVIDIATADQAAQALRPIAGAFAFAVFAVGIIGTGLLAVPVLAGSAAYAVSEMIDRPEGLDRPLRGAKAFYGVIALAVLAGVGLQLLPISPMKALYWAAILNGLLAAPLMAVIMRLASNPEIMGPLTLSRPVRLLGWAATAIMSLVAVGVILS
jgi:NRAMP (natural resistance-associated macrophage protein)-like metal ion transporter